jgi:hypothetical protein
MRRLLCVCVAGLASSLEAQSGPGPCPSEDAGLQIVLQAENVGQSSEPLFGVIRPLDETKPTPIVARTDPLEIHVGIASKLGTESGGVQGWLISARFLGDIEFVDAATDGTVAGDEAGGPPGIRKDGFEPRPGIERLGHSAVPDACRRNVGATARLPDDQAKCQAKRESPLSSVGRLHGGTGSYRSWS